MLPDLPHGLQYSAAAVEDRAERPVKLVFCLLPEDLFVHLKYFDAGVLVRYFHVLVLPVGLASLRVFALRPLLELTRLAALHGQVLL